MRCQHARACVCVCVCCLTHVAFKTAAYLWQYWSCHRTCVVHCRYILCAKTSEEKERWLDAFLQERAKAKADRDAGISLINSAAMNAEAGTRTSRAALCCVWVWVWVWCVSECGWVWVGVCVGVWVGVCACVSLSPFPPLGARLLCNILLMACPCA